MMGYALHRQRGLKPRLPGFIVSAVVNRAYRVGRVDKPRLPTLEQPA